MVKEPTSEACHCPFQDPANYQRANGCRAEMHPQIVADLATHRERGGIEEEALLQAVEDLPHRPRTAFIHYTVKGGELFSKCWGLCGFSKPVEAARAAPLPAPPPPPGALSALAGLAGLLPV